jgi:hypothetical protein
MVIVLNEIHRGFATLNFLLTHGHRLADIVSSFTDLITLQTLANLLHANMHVGLHRRQALVG